MQEVQHWRVVLPSKPLEVLLELDQEVVVVLQLELQLLLEDDLVDLEVLPESPFGPQVCPHVNVSRPRPSQHSPLRLQNDVQLQKVLEEVCHPGAVE